MEIAIYPRIERTEQISGRPRPPRQPSGKPAVFVRTIQICVETTLCRIGDTWPWLPCRSRDHLSVGGLADFRDHPFIAKKQFNVDTAVK